ncbi:hypothetical protein [Streptomyces phytophilus]|uniref:hypothetical protein n=1 Tax=Streptomyces phytophilus TaxID=722715 RepID=UPI0015F08CD3|nr:hypothetical protein [Streptomyces phytophilus]
MKIDLDKVLETVSELRDGLEELNEAEPAEGPRRKAKQERAEITRTLLYLAHLGDRARVEIMDVYHGYRQQDMRSGGERASE